MEVESVKRLKLRLAIVSAVAIAIILIFWPGYSLYKRHQEKSRVNQAQAFLAGGDYRNAAWFARLVLQGNPQNVEAWRVMATVADAYHSPAALEWWCKVAALSPTVENKLARAGAAMRYQRPPFPLAVQTLDELGACTNRIAYQLAYVELSCRLNQLEAAQAHMAEAVRLDPTNRAFQLSLAGLELNSTNAAKAAAARAVLERFAGDPALAVGALRSLVADQLAHGNLPQARKYLAQLLASPKAGLEDRLQYLLLLKRQSDGEFSSELAVVEQSAATNAASAVLVAGWLKANDQLPEAVRWLKTLPEKIAVQPAVRLVLADCYMTQNDWRALRELASKGGWNDLEFMRLAFLSHAWAQLGEAAVGNSYWRSAVGAAGAKLGALTALSGLAEQWGLVEPQEEVLGNIVQRFPGETWAGQALERLYLANGDTQGLKKFYEKQLALFPKDPKRKNNLALVCLLLNTNMDQAFHWAAEAHLQATNDVMIASTYAYALGLRGQAGEGLALLRRFPDEDLRQPSTALYEGVLLNMAGQKARAAEFLKMAAAGKNLLPEEKALLKHTPVQTP